jgi:hypothetical protein
VRAPLTLSPAAIRGYKPTAGGHPFKVTASVPELLFGSDVLAKGDQFYRYHLTMRLTQPYSGYGKVFATGHLYGTKYWAG